MRACTCVLAVAALAGLGVVTACEEPPTEGETVVCARAWTCSDSVVSEDQETFCTDPADAQRQERIDAYVAAFRETCGGVTVTCRDDEVATCAAQCAPTSTCPIEDAVFIRL